ncbi:hypothetical protein JTB14_010927 [Gonioctena quinquepunctata]|nr:hypothetical protein JTB14_010927 [Gonioctena quinquepunctata]
MYSFQYLNRCGASPNVLNIIRDFPRRGNEVNEEFLNLLAREEMRGRLRDLKIASWEKEQARLLKLFEETGSGSSNSESEPDADCAENNSSGNEENESTTDEEYEAPEEPENDETGHINTTPIRNFSFDADEENESTTDEEYEAPEEPENDETWHINTTPIRNFSLMQMRLGFFWI